MRRNKYHAVKTSAHGFVFDSKGEAARYGELRMLEMAGQVRKLRRQVAYPIDVNGVKVCKYVADFVYEELNKTRWTEVVEDFKGCRTSAGSLKVKLMRAVYGVDVRLTGRQKKAARRRPSSRGLGVMRVGPAS